MSINRLSAPFLLLTTVSAFSGPLTPLVTKHDVTRSSTRVSLNKRNDDMLQNRIRVFGVAAAILAFNTATVSSAIAETPPVNEFMYSSSIQISETIKTMDFSMPSDYSSISGTKSSAGISVLSKEEDLITGKEVKQVKKAPTPAKAVKAKPSDGGGGKTALTPEEREKIALQKSAEREAAAQEKAALEAEKRVEREALDAQKQADRKSQEAAREAERAQASAEKAEKQQAAKEAKASEDAGKAEKSEQKAKDKLYKGADFVEEGLPSYGF